MDALLAVTAQAIPTEAINPAYIPHLNNLARLQIYFGGSSSGKSVFLAQRDLIDLDRGGRNFLVCRQVKNTLRGSVMQEVKKLIDEHNLSDRVSVNKTDGTVTHRNGYQIVFVGLDDVEKLKSVTPAKGVFTDVRVEEATETDKPTIKQLLKRQRGGDPNTPKRLVLSFNPILKSHWIFEEYFSQIGWADDQKEYVDGRRLSILKTTYKDNRFLTPEDIFDLENETDKYYYDVYTLGKWGLLGHVIFTNYVVADLNNMGDPYYLPIEQRTNRRNGLDFGFSSNPAALSRSHYDRTRKRIYIFDELYETGLTNDVLAERLLEKIGQDAVVCDSAEPKSIAELQGYGVNASGARKGKDSVNFGIQWLKQHLIIIHKACINAQNEFSTYHYKEDAHGNATKVPVDRNNHLIDGTRYSYEDDMTGDGEMTAGANPASGYRG